ncbi:MAG: hypothetical protein KGH74_03650 [Candidatus Micrarchaeota archaeon]|nr:hypothetical protein [Candidatus Micrarchaeota archaeon]
MCNAFSCLITRQRKVLWKAGVDSHSDLVSLFKLDDTKKPVTKEGLDYMARNNPDTWPVRTVKALEPILAALESSFLATERLGELRKWVEARIDKNHKFGKDILSDVQQVAFRSMRDKIDSLSSTEAAEEL